MSVMDSSLTTMAPILLRNLVTSMFIFADKSILNLSQKFKLLELIRYVLITSFLFFLRLLPTFFDNSFEADSQNTYPLKPPKADDHDTAATRGYGGHDSGIARALSQLLSIVNDIPVSSRKYEVVRSLAGKLIDENNREGTESLREVNRRVLSSAFTRTLRQLQAAMVDQGFGQGLNGGLGSGLVDNRLNRVVRTVRSVRDAVRAKVGRARESTSQTGISAEKLAAELLWLAEKLAACGYVEESCSRWASASHLAWLALHAEPRLQGSLVKVSEFLFKQGKDMGLDEVEESKKEQQRQTKLKMLLSWLPLLCRASNGTDVPVMSIRERSELERVLEETIDQMLELEEQEQVLSLWLHHYTYCPSSDWPNLYSSYSRWYNASRRFFVLK